MSDAPDPTPDKPRPADRKRALLRAAVLTAAILPVLAGVALWVVTRSWFIILLAAPGLEQRLGGEVRIGDAAYRGDGTLVFEDLVLSTGKHLGPAAKVLRIGRAEIVVDPDSLFGGEGVKVEKVELDDVLFRLSEDRRRPGVFNFGALEPKWSSESGTEVTLPSSVIIKSAVIEVGEHEGREYRAVGDRHMTGEMYPDPNQNGWYVLKLQELDANDVSLGAYGLSVDGRWNVETLEHHVEIEGLTLDDRTYGMCPQMARNWWRQMQPDGPVGKAVIEWRQGEQFKARLDVGRMALTIPINADFSAPGANGEVESIARMPRMYVKKGRIRLEGNRLALENLEGAFGSSRAALDLEEMPYTVNFAFEELPTFDWKHPQEWMQQVVSAAPFRMTVDMENFQLQESSTAPPVELPSQVADTLRKFRLEGWSLTTIVEITRGPPEGGPGGEAVPAKIRTLGRAKIADASGAFEGFPYPLDNVTASVEFDRDEVKIEYLQATGSGNATLRMEGSIREPGRDAAIHLTLTARDLPLDDRFREGLKPAQKAVYDVMLHKPAFEMLRAEGLLPDESSREAARQERQDRVAELVALDESPAPAGEEAAAERARTRDRLLREINRLDVIEEKGEFELGGLIDLDLVIDREKGGERPVITGTVSVKRAGVVYGRFPYPIYVGEGLLHIEADGVAIDPGPTGRGLPIATPGGGRGYISGEVGVVHDDDATRVEPDIDFVLIDDKMSDLLVAAMPLTEEDKTSPDIASLQAVPRRSLIARILAGSGLSGWLNHSGSIETGPDGRPTYDVALELFDGRAEPNEELFETLTELDMPAPRGISFDSVEAILNVTPQRIRLVDFTGRHGRAEITAEATVDLKADPVEADVTVRFDDLELERYMVELTPKAGVAKTRELWDTYQPQGMYDARLRYRSRGKTTDLAEVTVWPEELQVTIDGTPVWLICDQGQVRLHEKQVSFDDLLLRLRSGDRDDGVIGLSGSYGLAGETRTLELAGAWRGGQLASPLIPETLRLIGADEHADRYAKFDPHGVFDAEFSYESPQDGTAKRYRFTVQPRTLGLHVRDTPIFAELTDGAEIVFTPGRIVMRNVEGEHAGGRFRLDGAIDVDGPLDVDMDVAYFGRIDSPQIMAILPATVRSALEKLEMHAAEPVQLGGARLQVSQVETEGETAWETAFHGILETNGASMKVAGVELTEVDGAFELEAEHDPELGVHLEVRADADRALAAGRELTAVKGQVILAENGRVVEIPRLRADAYGGVISARAVVGLDEGSPYDVSIDLGAVGLSGIASPEEAARGGKAPEGETYGSLRLSGRKGSPESRRGRGAIRVAYGRMADLPITLRVLQLFELMPPFSGTLDFADVDFYVDGESFVFERLMLECPTLQMHGAGSMTFPGFELDLRLRTRGTVPVIHDIIAALSDQLFLVEITGTIGDPKAKLVALPGMSQSAPAPEPEPTQAAQAE